MGKDYTAIRQRMESWGPVVSEDVALAILLILVTPSESVIQILPNPQFKRAKSVNGIT